MGERTSRNGLLAFASGLACLVYTIDSSIANVALPHIQGDLQASYDQIGWVLTAYVIASAIATPLSGWLALRFGLRAVMLASTAAFTITSMLCGLAGSLETLVLFRTAQGMAGAALVPLSQVLLLAAYPPHRAGWAMGLWGMGVMTGPIIGPLAGGILTDTLSWRWVFFVNLPIGVLAFVLLAASARRDERSTARPFDVLGFVLLAGAVGLAQLCLDRGSGLGWFESGEILAEAFFAVILLYMFVVHCRTTEHPFMDTHLFRDRNFVVGLFAAFAIGILIYGVVTLMPLYLQHLIGLTPTQAGVLVAPRGAGTVITTLVAGRLLAQGIDARYVAAAGALCMAAASVPMMHLTLDTSTTVLAGCQFLQGLGIGMVVVPLSTLIFATLRPDQRTEAGVTSSLARNVGSSIGISVALTLLTRSSQANNARLVEFLTPFDAQRWEPVRSVLGDQAVPVMAGEVARQAAVIAYDNDFAIIVAIAVLVLPLLLLFRLPKVAPAAPARPGVSSAFEEAH